MNPLDPQKSILIIKNNIISVLSLSIKSLLEKSCLHDTLDDIPIEVNNFLTILEHVIYFCVKGNGLMLSVQMKQHPWKLFLENCKSIPNNCIPTIHEIDNLSSNFSKVRAIIRMGLIEKRLHEYLSSAFNDKKLNSKFYTSDSIILSGHLPNIINALIGLSAVNFSFDLKLDINHPGFYPIDYSSYLKFYQSPQSVLDDLVECNLPHDNNEYCHWRNNYEDILAKAKLESKQKSYLEEVLLNRETISLALENRNKILESEVKTLEASVTDLQIQLTLLHEQYSKEIERLGGNISHLSVPSVKSAAGSRADVLSDRHPIASHISKIDEENPDFVKSSQPFSPLFQLVPFAFDGVVRDSYNKLTKMASSTGDLRSVNSKCSYNKDSNQNNNNISEKFVVGPQVMSDVTQHYYSPTNRQNRVSSMNSNQMENSSDYSSRLFNIALEEQRTRIMESQELRKIMVKARRSPKIKAHQYAQFMDASKSLSFDLDNYSLDESMSDDGMDSRNSNFNEIPIFAQSHNCTNSHNNTAFPSNNKHTPKEDPCPVNVTNYYYLSSASTSEQLNEENYFNVDSSIANELVHSESVLYNASNNIQLQPHPEIGRLSPVVTAEVPQNLEPLISEREVFRTSDNYINGDRSSGRPRDS